jgi:hypothetical protein
MPDSDKKHIIISPNLFSDTVKYLYPRTPPRSKEIPLQNRKTHSDFLFNQTSVLTKEMFAAKVIQEKSRIEMDYGLLVEFESFERIGTVFEDCSFTSKSELRNIRHENNKTYATVFIPDGDLPKLEKKIQNYVEQKKKANGDANDNRPLIDTIQNLRKATIKNLWTDTDDSFPSTSDEVFCWEVWITAKGDRTKQREIFVKNAENIQMQISKEYFEFRERTVLLVRATKSQFEASIDLLNNIAELRKAKTIADFLADIPLSQQTEWTDDLLQRLNISNLLPTTPYICILDTGINSAHPLLERLLTADDIFTINEAWGKADIAGHGTEIAGLALYGDLSGMWDTDDKYAITYRLESSKIINSLKYVPETDRPLDLFANHTQQAISRAEIAHINRKRIFQLAITASDNRDNGKHSSWSSALDKFAFGSDNQGNTRLCVVSAGNVEHFSGEQPYPEQNKKEGVHDPAQAWNVITVGAYTEKNVLSPDESMDKNTPTALPGGLSPYSTTSVLWDKQWPYKPDILLEGGNTAQNPYGQAQAASLSLLTTSHNITEKYFTTIWATSASSALASKMCAQIISDYPELRPETVRGLMIHSADWTPEMLRQFDCARPQNKKAYKNLLRICGFGVPDITKAITSYRNDFTILIEDSLQPFIKAKPAKNNEMKFYNLPFPTKELENLGPTDVEMRVTLSYFIEPNPSSRGRSRYLYESHGLRFDLKTPAETNENFRGRINRTYQEEDESYANEEADEWWTLGIMSRTKGSIHSDIWRGTAAQLAGCNQLAVFPTGGWWKRNSDTVNNIAKFSLLVSVRTSADIDLKTPVLNIIENKIKTPIRV